MVDMKHDAEFSGWAAAASNATEAIAHEDPESKP
jgi:hypothetical protein